MSPGYLLVHNKLHQVSRDEAVTFLLCSLIPWSEVQTDARRDGCSFLWCLGPEVGRLKQLRLAGMAEGWNHGEGPCGAPGLGSVGIVGCRAHNGLSVWLGLFTAWWLGSQGSTPRKKVPHFESQTIIFLEAHGILGSGMGLNLCSPTT